EAVVVRGREGKRPVGVEVVYPAKVVLPVDREPVLLEAAVDRPHLVGGLLDGHAGSKSSGRESERAVGVVDRGVVGTRLVDLRETVFTGPREARPDPDASVLVAEIVVVHLA